MNYQASQGSRLGYCRGSHRDGAGRVAGEQQILGCAKDDRKKCKGKNRERFKGKTEKSAEVKIDKSAKVKTEKGAKAKTEKSAEVKNRKKCRGKSGFFAALRMTNRNS